MHEKPINSSDGQDILSFMEPKDSTRVHKTLPMYQVLSYIRAFLVTLQTRDPV
jgi:hypothetical protein